MRKKFTLDAAALLALLAKENAGAVVIGLPVNMDGSEGPRAQKSRAFVRNMAQPDRPAVRVLGRAPVDGGGRAHADRDGCVARRSATARSIRPPPPSSCRACSTGFTHWAPIRRRNIAPAQQPQPGGDQLAAAERPDRQHAATYRGCRPWRPSTGWSRDRCRASRRKARRQPGLNAAAQHHVAEIHVVERQEIPAPEEHQRRSPEREDVAHQRRSRTQARRTAHMTDRNGFCSGVRDGLARMGYLALLARDSARLRAARNVNHLLRLTHNVHDRAAPGDAAA